MKFIKNKYFLLGNLVLILLAIPLTLFLVRQQQEQRSSASPTSVVFIQPRATTTNVGEDFTVDVMVDPGENLVSTVDPHILFDAEKLEFVEFQPNVTSFPQTLTEPVVTDGSLNFSVTIGNDVTQTIQTVTKVGTITFKALAVTDGNPTLISFDNTQSRAFSLRGNEDGTCPTPDLDCPGENVLQSTTPGSVTINGEGEVPTPTEDLSPTPTDSEPTPSASPSAAPPGGGVANVNPVCTGLAIDRELTGTAPYSLTFTANGSDSDGTIQKVTFNFGDGPTQDVLSAGGIGTGNVSVQVAHTYTNAGTYQATATLTDSDNAISDPGTCTQTITVNAGEPTDAPVGGGDSGATPTLEAPGGLAQTLGIVGAVVFTVIGGIFLFTL